jgi:hypothetical protein
MLRSSLASLFAVVFATAGLAACGGSKTTSGDGGVAIDGGGTRDGGTTTADGGTTGTDGGPRTDGGSDGGTTGPLCNTLPVENLNTLGTVAGGKLTYVGNNSATSTSLTVGLQVPAQLQSDGSDPGLCFFRIGRQRVFQYTATAASALRISTTNAGTDVFMDTVVYVVDATGSAATSACSRTPALSTFLGCNDDDPLYSGEQRRISSRAVTYKQVAAGAKVYIGVGGYVSTTSSSRDPAREVGTFELTVEELPAVADGSACDARRLDSVCADASTCVQAAISSTMGTCRVNGSVAGALCDSTDNCVSPLGCDTNSGICVTEVTDGMPCDAFSQCTSTSSCVGSGERGFISGVCRANGTAALTACNASGGCDSGLTCREGACFISATTSCSVWDTSCPQNTTTPSMNQDCVSTSATGTDGVCTQTGTTAGTSCTGTCTSPLVCDADAQTCHATRTAGQTCGINESCATGSTCFLEDFNDRFHGKCFADGALGGRCLDSSTPCSSGAVCSDPDDPTSGRCIQNNVANGAACTGTARCSDTGSECAPDATSRTGPFQGTCRAIGTAAGTSCRPSMSPACDGALVCSTFLPESGICQTAGTAGGECDARYGTIRCPTGQVCRSTSLHLAGTCSAPTTEPNADSNDNPWTLSSPPAAVTLPTAIKGSLAFFDRDCYRVSVPAAGKLYAGVTSGNGVCPPFFDVQLDVYRYDSTLQRARLLGTDSSSGLSGCPRIEGGDANGNFNWATNSGSNPLDLYVCVQSAADDRAPLGDYVLSLAIN